MTTFVADFRNLLLGDAGVATLVATRVHWSVRPQAVALPAIVLHLIRAPIVYHLGGASGPEVDRVQVDCQAIGTAAGSGFFNAQALGDAVAAVLSGYAGTHGATIFQGIFQDTARDLSETGAAEQQVSVYSLDFIIHHTAQE